MPRRLKLTALHLILAAASILARPLAGQSQPAAAAAPFGLSNGSAVETGVTAAGQPTEEQLRALAAAGYKTVLDLRGTGEDRGFAEPEKAKELGLHYLAIPVTLDTLDAAAIDRFRQAYKTAEHPVLLHCSTSNRAGAMLYAHWVLDRGVAPEEALAKAQAAGLKSPELTEKVRALVEGMRRDGPR